MFDITAVGFLAIGGLPESADAGTLRRGNGPEPSTLDAHRCPEVACQNILRDLYEGLVAEDAAGAIIPGMAEAWTRSDDGLAWTFRLREGLAWSDGRPLDAGQWVASLRRAKYWPPVGRVDNVYGDRNLFCSCVPVGDYAGD